MSIASASKAGRDLVTTQHERDIRQPSSGVELVLLEADNANLVESVL